MADQNVHQIDDVRGSGVYPATGPFPAGNAPVRSPAALAHPEERQSLRRTGPTLDTMIHLAGRLIFGGYFLYNGINHMVNRRMMAAYAGGKGVPAPDFAVVASGALILAGGMAILLGRKPKLGAGLLTTFLLGVSPAMHGFWNEEDPQQRMQEMVNFTKNMALVGASLLIAAHPEPWPWRASMPSSRSVALVRGTV